MTVYIIGGSNSIPKNGWVANIKAQFPGTVNLAIGSSTSHMGLFRFLQHGKIGPGDVVLWTYSMMDLTAVDKGRQTREQMLAAVEHLICLTRDVGAAFATLTFNILKTEEEGLNAENHAPFSQLLTGYGLTAFDMNKQLRLSFNVPKLTADFFQDSAHFRISPDISAAIAIAASNAIMDARIPNQIPPYYIKDKRLALVVGMPTHLYQNSLISMPVHHGPVSFDLPERGEVLGVYFAMALAPSRWRVVLHPLGDGEKRRLVGKRLGLQERRRFRCVVPNDPKSDKWLYEPGARVTVDTRYLPMTLSERLSLARKTRTWPWSKSLGVQPAGVLVAIDETGAAQQD